jgi:phytoene synthase
VSKADEAVNIEAVRDSARLNAPSRYYAALFAPSQFADDLIAAAAFDGEIARISRQTRDPALGEIRLAWWRDALLGKGEDRTGHPVLDRFADVVRRRALPAARLEDYFAAHAEALYPDPPADETALARSLIAIDGTPLAFAAQILTGPLDEPARALFDSAARAAGLARIAVELPYALAAGRLPLPAALSPNPYMTDGAENWRPQIAWLASEAKAALASVRRQLAGGPRSFTTALLPLALIEPYFRALQRPGHEPGRDFVEITPLARLWRIARAHWARKL